MKFAVPQFIDVEDKVFGQLTFKQGIYLAGGAGFTVFLFVISNLFVAILLGLPMLLFAFALSFIKVNNRPFIATLESAFFYATKRKLYLWKKSPTTSHVVRVDPATAPTKLVVPRLTENKLKQLAWSLDIKQATPLEQ